MSTPSSTPDRSERARGRAAESVIEELGRHDVASIVARFDARSRVKMADDALVAVDTSGTSFFNIDIGLAIWE